MRGLMRARGSGRGARAVTHGRSRRFEIDRGGHTTLRRHLGGLFKGLAAWPNLPLVEVSEAHGDKARAGRRAAIEYPAEMGEEVLETGMEDVPLHAAGRP